MKYLIAVEQRKCFGGVPVGGYSQEVEGEEVIIPGFEQVKLFARRDRDDELGDIWSISETITGRVVVGFEYCMPTKEAAVNRAAKILNGKGLQATLDRMKTFKTVTEYPRYPTGKEELK